MARESFVERPDIDVLRVARAALACLACALAALGAHVDVLAQEAKPEPKAPAKAERKREAPSPQKAKSKKEMKRKETNGDTYRRSERKAEPQFERDPCNINPNAPGCD